MAPPLPALSDADWLRIRDALRYVGRELHHRSFAVNEQRRALLWEEMDRCLALAERIEAVCPPSGAVDLAADGPAVSDEP
ncbi:MAG: hypothetical protein ACKOZT_10510 [Cyanobium sp.]